MAEPSVGRVALMAIHPRYAEAILDGSKTVEFRKRALASDITHVLIYATSPVSRVIGKFSVKEIVDGTPAEIWHHYGTQGCIEQADFQAYYAHSNRAVGLLVESAERLSDEIPLSDFEPVPAVPQSFSYLPQGTLCQGFPISPQQTVLF